MISDFARRTSAFLLLLSLVGCQAIRLERAHVASPSDWLTEGDSPQRANAADAALEPPLERVWDYNAGGGFGPSSPLILGDAVLVATRKGEVHAIDLETGRKRGVAEFGDAIEGSAVIGDGMLYVPVDWGGRAIQAYDLMRARSQWKARSAPVRAGLLLVDGALVAADTEGLVRAYDRDRGEVLWEYDLGRQVGVEATPMAIEGNRIIVADDRGRVRALRGEDGTELWSRHLDAPVHATPAAAGGALFVATTRGRLFALDAATGTVQWRYAVPDTNVYLTAPAVAGDALVVGASDGVVRMLDPQTGAERWVQPLEEAVAAAPLLTASAVYVGTMDSRLVALDRSTGEVQWSEELEGRIKSPLAIKNGYLVVLSEPRVVYAFRQASSDYADAKK